jgi:purine-binding chemotaxis protein CheW
MSGATAKEKKKTAAHEASVQLVTFQVGAEEYGLDIRSITEVIRPLKITPLPKMPDFMEGVINLRGVIIPIVDLRKRFALTNIISNPRTLRMVITRGSVPGAPGGGKELLGLIVDTVKEVLYIPQKDIEPPPAATAGQNAEFITGMGKVGARLIILIDISRILSQQERTALVEAGNAGY